MYEKEKRKKSQLNIMKQILHALPRNDRRKLGIVAVVQVALGLLDLAALAIMGLLGTLAVSGVTQAPKPKKFDFIFLRELGPLTFQQQVAILGSVAAFFLIGRTAVTMYLTRKTLFFLSMKSANLSTTLVKKLLSSDLLTVLSRSKQETLYALTSGVNRILIGVLGVGIQLIADFSLLVLMTIGLFIVDPLISITTVVLFGAISVLLYFFMHNKAAKLGDISTDLNIRSSEKIFEVLDTYREAVVKNRRNYYSRNISELRLELADAEAEIAFMPSISKYIIEISVVVGALFICGLQFALKDAVNAVATLVVFLTAGTRIAPAVLRLQQSSIAVKTSIASAGPTLELIDDLRKSKISNTEETNSIITKHDGFIPAIQFRDMSFVYPGGVRAVSSIDIEIKSGEFVAIAGPSGAGKTTIVDVLLGVLSPTSGSIYISGVHPASAINQWPGAVSYVPQDVKIIRGTIKENVCLGYDAKNLDDELVWNALRDASIHEYVKSLPRGIETVIGDGGLKVSGGQSQRLGIARGLVSNPKLLVLDEATSALDGKTESEITNTILKLKGNRTVFVIAHRLSSVRLADKIIYMEKGKVIAIGTFEEVRANVPNFNEQANLMGL